MGSALGRVDTVDTVIVGGGLAGMVAATRLAKEGRRVVVLEKGTEERYLCNSRVAGGVFHVAARDIFSDERELEEAIVKATDGHANMRLAKAMAKDAKRVGRWLQSLGLRFMRASAEPFHNFVLAPPALIRAGLEFEGRAGDVALRTLEEVLLGCGGRVLRGHRATGLLGSAGLCTGVEGETAEGARFQVTAAHTLICDGGFQADAQLLREHISPAPHKLLQRNARTGSGDGVRMALAFGAQLTRMDGFYGHVLARDAMTNPMLWPMPWLDDVATAGFVVDGRGRRFCNEGNGGVFIANRIAELQDPLSAFIVFDEKIWEVAGASRFFPARPYLEDHGARLLRDTSVAGLAAQAGLPADVLAQEVQDFNAAIASGALAALQPARTELKAKAMPIVGGTYMAAPVCAGITYTMGGIRIDEYSRVLGTSGDPIRHLYAAGAATGGLEGGDRVGYVGGLTKASVTGMRAAEHMLGVWA